MDSYVGKRLDGRYEIREIIGVGGMAVVYKAYDNIDDRIVAVKILKEEFLANEEFRRRFKNESKAIAVLSHPNIVKVYDVSFGDRLQYIVMEYIEGITLKEYIEQQKVINWKESVHFATQILRALQHAHDKGIVHRDVKPQNILLLQNGNIKVTDFGIARFSRSETRTMTESAIGSVHYISPEQARGEITDDKADIYSVGVVLYEMTTGELPFQSDSAVSVAIMQLQADAKKPREINSNIPLGLEQITMRAMQKSPKERYQSAAEMLLDLDEFKRNPAIKFDYTYFVDTEPTKFLNKPTQSTSSLNSEMDEELEDEYYEDDDRKKTLPILIGVLSALLAIILITMGGLFFFTDVFKSEKIEVPNFVGMYYEDDIKDNPEYDDYKFSVTYVNSSSSNSGQVSKQSPYASSKVTKGTTIKLEVVSGGTKKTIPDIENVDIATAKQMLSAEGFTSVNIIKQYNAKLDKGTVIKSEPSGGTKADVSTTITIYVATDVDENLVEVPNVCEMSQADAKVFLESVNLVLGKVTEEDSNLPKGQVIRQSIDNPEPVPKGTKIDIVVSSGVPSVGNTTITIKLPDDSGKNGVCKVYVNNELLSSKNTLLDGANYSFEVQGSGASNKVKVLIDSFVLYECNIDFTKNPAAIGNVINSVDKYPVSKEVPPVIGMTFDDAKKELAKYGFTNVTKTEKPSATENIGKVIIQSEDAGTKAKTTDEIKLTIGKSYSLF
ncbi:MAG: Stk1 family PASTA domain-containing Ser/Thr kinase [Clostridia bacterium]|nr:Stk1 family PASTA domain-containing Ser/Thr kinase [Clostridia bacterium]